MIGSRHSARAVAPDRDAGFTLVEVLVALVVLAIGGLGLIALQVRGLRFTHDAYIRSQATISAYDLAERIRNNRSNAAAYIVAADPAGNCAPAGAGVTNDLNCWYESLAANLPAGSGSVAVDPANPDGYLITITWADRLSGGTNTQQWAVEP